MPEPPVTPPTHQALNPAHARARVVGPPERRHLAGVAAEDRAFLAHDLKDPLTVILAAAGLLLEVDLAADARAGVPSETRDDTRAYPARSDAPRAVVAPVVDARASAVVRRVDHATCGAPAESAARRHVEMIRRAAERMHAMIDAILHQHHEGRAGQPTVGLVPVVWLLNEVGHAARPLAALADMTVVIREPVCAACLVGDREGLRRLLANVVGNALRHGAPGSRIELGAEVEAATVRLTVTDRPRGDSERAWRPHADRRRAARRTDAPHGLGLQIVHRLMAAHGGTTTVARLAGGGHVVTLALPLPAPVRT